MTTTAQAGTPSPVEHLKQAVAARQLPVRGTIVAFPHAGGGTHTFGRWRRHVPPDVNLLAVLLPGRERLIHRPPVRSLEEAVDLCTADLLRFIGTGGEGSGPSGPSGPSCPAEVPLVFYGQCSGAVLALEVARRLRAVGGPVPHLLCLASQAFPIDDGGTPEPIEVEAERLFRRSFPDVAGLPGRIAQELWAVVGGPMRQDMVLTRGYLPLTGDPLPTALTVLVGADDPELAPEQTDGWRDVVTGPFRRHVLPGGHLLSGMEEKVLAHIVADWQDAGPGAASTRTGEQA